MTYLAKFIELLTAEQGLTVSQLAERGNFRSGPCAREVSRLVSLGRLASIRVSPCSRIFTDAEALDAAREQIAADEAAHRLVMEAARIARHRRYNTKQAAAYRAAQPPKQPKPPKVKPPKPPKPIKFAKPKPQKVVPPKFADRPVVVPDHVKVQVLPGFTGAPKWEINGKTWR